MTPEEKQALQVTKEIVVKFIEVGKITPSNFEEHFSAIYRRVLAAIHSGQTPAPGKQA